MILEQDRALEKEVQSLLAKGAIECIPPIEWDSGFYSQYFIHPNKDGRLSPITDLRQLNHSLRIFRFKMLMILLIVSQIKSENWFFTINLKIYFHPYSTQEVT